MACKSLLHTVSWKIGEAFKVVPVLQSSQLKPFSGCSLDASRPSLPSQSLCQGALAGQFAGAQLQLPRPRSWFAAASGSARRFHRSDRFQRSPLGNRSPRNQNCSVRSHSASLSDSTAARPVPEVQNRLPQLQLLLPVGQHMPQQIWNPPVRHPPHGKQQPDPSARGLSKPPLALRRQHLKDIPPRPSALGRPRPHPANPRPQLRRSWLLHEHLLGGQPGSLPSLSGGVPELRLPLPARLGRHPSSTPPETLPPKLLMPRPNAQTIPRRLCGHVLRCLENTGPVPLQP
mmetsp:Transcript_59132/g.106309  ORF Transcript_59132/g.106309 Transcript_59132/m.106309 type:complete len:288 (+) Transcript_59132:330-1193(+)